MRVVRVLASVLVAAVLGPAVNASPGSNERIAFLLKENGAIVVPVTLGNAGPFPFLLDTGSNTSLISESLAARLRTPFVAKTPLATSTGFQMLPIARVDGVTIGPVSVDGIQAVVVPDGKLAAEHVVGVIGQDFLGGLNYTLDYRHRTLSWEALPSAPTAGARLDLEWTEGRFLVRLPQDPADGHVLRFVPDTGAASVVVFTRPGHPYAELEPLPGRVRLSSVTGQRDVERGVMNALRVGGVVWRREPVVVVDRPEAEAPEGDGLLPLHRFARVSFNAQQRYMTVE